MNDDIYQYALVGNLLQGGSGRRRTLAEIRQQGFKPDYVTDSVLRTVYDALVAEKTDDGSLLRAKASQVASPEILQKAAESGSVDPTDYERVVSHVKDAGIRTLALSLVNRRLNNPNATGEFFLSEAICGLSTLMREVATTAASSGFSLDDIGDPIPEDEDPNCLLAGGFLEKGGGLVLTSVSGSGKSSLLMQFAFAWALGREMFGLRPLRPLKIGIFQTENSEQDLARFSHDVQAGLVRFCGWTEEDLKTAKRNIRFFDPNNKSGDEFLSLVRLEQIKGKFDLIVIDPLTGVTDFDISDNTKMNDYLTKRVDPIIKHDAETKCGLMIVHHTNKPPAANQRAGFGTDQYAQYVGSGAAKLTNWMRAMLAVMPTDESRQYKLVVAKRDERLDWPPFYEKNGKESAKATRLIRHSTREERLIFWHEAAAPGASTPRPEKPCAAKDAARLAKVLQQDAMTLTEARKFAKEMFGRKRGEAAYDEMFAHLSDYHVVVKPTGSTNQSIVGSRESVEKKFSTMQAEAAQKLRAKLVKMDEKN